MASIKAGNATYGHSIGIVMQHDGLIRLPGDVGNLTTYSFPVTYAIVDPVPDSVLKTSVVLDYADPYVEAACELERLGCTAITTGCGFLSLLQPVLSTAVHVPVFSSSLIQVPLVSAMLRPGQKVGIMTAGAATLSEEHFQAVGWSSSDYPVSVIGIEEEDPENSFSRYNLMRVADHPKAISIMEAGMIRLAKRLVDRDPSVGAIVFECTNMPPFARAVQRAVNLPVFDIVTLINMVHETIVRRPYDGHL
jgi:hypothetical protein